MQRRPLQVPLHLAEARSKAVSNELSVNAWSQQVNTEKGSFVVNSHPGLDLFRNLGGVYRGSIELDEIPYVVIGSALMKLGVDGSPTVLGTIPEAGLVTIAGDLGKFVVTVASGASYYWNGMALVQITTGTYQPASSVAYLNGTTLWSVTGSDQMIWSAVNDPTTIDGLDVVSAEYVSDNLVRVYPYRGDLLLFGTRSVENFYDTGETPNAYQRRGDTLLKTGLAGKFAVADVSDVVVFLAVDKTVRMVEQGQAVRISNDAVAKRIKTWRDLSQARVFAYVYADHLFFTIWHPDGCVQYDLTTQDWSVRRSYGSRTWRIVGSLFTGLGWLLIDANGKLYTLSETTRYEDGDIVEWIGVTQFASNSGLRMSIASAEFAFDTGRPTDLELDPQAVIEWSDNGYLWKGGVQRSLKKTGNYGRRCKVNRQGETRQRQYRITVTDDVPVTLMNIWLDAEGRRG